MRLWLSVIFLITICSGISFAERSTAWWEARLAGGTYLVSLDSISSISTHEYIVDGAIAVYEMTVATNGSAIGRFYSVEPYTPPTGSGAAAAVIDKSKELTKEAMDKASRVTGGAADGADNTVVKNYPASTHAHTIEYRLKNRDEVNKLYKSLDLAWRRGLDTSIRIE